MSEHVGHDGMAARRAWHQQPLTRFGLWAVGGAVVGYGVGQLLAEYEDQVPVLAAFTGWAKASTMTELLAALLAFVMILVSVPLLVMGTYDDNRLRRMLKMEPDDNPDRMRRMLPIGGWGMLLYAGIILIFLIPGIPPTIGIAAGISSFAAVTWLFYRGTVLMDEMEQAAQREAIIATFLLIEALGVGWALLHHYALVPVIEPLALVLILVVIYYAAGTIAGFRRGVGR